jgi:DNA-binding NarL/FixJ family response regulator
MMKYTQQIGYSYLDIMPEKDGIEVIKEFAKRISKSIILSSYDDLRIIRSHEISCSGYLTKKCAGENIVEAYMLF